jgi:hypothetical protein
VGVAAVVLAFVTGLRIAGERSAPDATLVIETQPAGWHVWDGDLDRGVTPLTVTLPPGRRTLSLRRDSLTRQLHVELAAGSRLVHHLELAPAVPPIGDLRVETIPPGAVVAVDGIARGVAPVDVRDLQAGPHVVTLIDRDRVISQAVTVTAGVLGSLVVPLVQTSAPAVGWLTLKASADLEVFEGESLVGSTRNPRLLFMPGRHSLRLVNRDLGVEVEKTVDVGPGSSSTLTVGLPSGRLSVNAMPWAEVLMDGVRIGETPIAEYEASVGAHELIFRHPTLGEQRRSIVVSLTTPLRLGVDLRQ